MRRTWFAAIAFLPVVAMGATVDVSVIDFAFVPPNVTIAPGDTVRWTFSSMHTTTSDAGSTESWDSGTLTSGGTFSHTFSAIGNNPYHCSLHSFMTGSVTVALASAPTITSVTPPSAAPGVVVTITGTGFQAGATVTFAGTGSPSATVLNATTIQATVPSLPAGAATIVVTNPDRQSASFNGFTVVAAAAIPLLSREALLLLTLAIAVIATLLLRR